MRGIHVFRDEHELGDLVLRVVAALLLGTGVRVYAVDDCGEPCVGTTKLREAVSDVLAQLGTGITGWNSIQETAFNKLTKSTAKRPMEVVRPGGDEQRVNAGNTLSDYSKLVNSILHRIIVGIARADLCTGTRIVDKRDSRIGGLKLRSGLGRAGPGGAVARERLTWPNSLFVGRIK